MSKDRICYVVQGFGRKTDYETGRVLDLDASYQVIRAAAEQSGLRCLRTDEIAQSDSLAGLSYEYNDVA